MIWWDKYAANTPDYAFPTHECTGAANETLCGDNVCMQREVKAIRDENSDDIKRFKLMNKQFGIDYKDQSCVMSIELEARISQNDTPKSTDSYGVNIFYSEAKPGAAYKMFAAGAMAVVMSLAVFI